MPVTDTQLWVEIHKKNKGIPKFIEGEHPECKMPEVPKCIVMYCFFKKPMASTRNNLNRGGLPKSSKVATAVNEVLRRLKNTSRELEDTVVEDVIKDYMTELRWGEYPLEFRINTLNSAFKGYAKI